MNNKEYYTHQTKKDSNWNFWINVGDSAFVNLSGSFVFISTLLPLYVSHFTESVILIGLVPSIYILASHLPQLFFSSYAESLDKIKPWVVKISAFERIPWLLLGLSIILWPDAPKWLSYCSIVLTILVANTAVGVASPAWKALLSKVIHPDQKGRMFGIGAALGGLMGAGGALFAQHILKVMPFPISYGLCFLCAFVGQAVSWTFLTLNREPVKTTNRTTVKITVYLHELTRILKVNNNFRWFLISQTLIILGKLGVTFYIIYGKYNFKIIDSYAASLTIAALIGQFIGSPLIGWIGDRLGHKSAIELSTVFSVVAGLLITFAPNAQWLYPVFILLTMSDVGGRVTQGTFVMDMGYKETKIATYSALATTILSIPALLSPIIGGWLIEFFNFRIIFLLGVLISSCGFLITYFKLVDPRIYNSNNNTTK